MHKYTFLKDAALLIGGLIVGYVTGKYVTRVKYESVIENELQHIRETYAKPKVETTVAANSADGNIHTIGEAYVKPEIHDYTAHYQHVAVSSETTETEIEAAEAEAPSELDALEYNSGNNGYSKVISAAEYGDNPTYNCMQLLYYTENDILTITEGENVEDILYVDEIEDHIGDALTRFGFKTNDQSILYVRNYKSGCDYCIKKVRKAYGED